MTTPGYPFPVKTKAPAEVLDYLFPWGGEYLQPGELITTRTVTVATGLNKDADSITADQRNILVWLSGGTLGQQYLVSCTITTSLNRTAKRNALVKLAER